MENCKCFDNYYYCGIDDMEDKIYDTEKGNPVKSNLNL